MNHATKRILGELRQNIADLSGDLIALETFYRCGERSWDYCGLYQQRMADYLRQHISEISHLSEILLRTADSPPSKAETACCTAVLPAKKAPGRRAVRERFGETPQGQECLRVR